MFLGFLSDKQKEYFMELSNRAMLANGEIKASELGIIEGFRAEMGLMEYEMKNTETNELVALLSGASKKVHRTIIIELLGVLLADDEFSRDEQEFIEKICVQWNIKDRELKQMTRFVEDFNDILEDGYALIVK